MDDHSWNKEIKTAAGFGSPVRRSRLGQFRRELPNFIRKNRGLLAKPEFWRLMLRLVRARAHPHAQGGPVMFVATHHKVMTTYFSAVMKLLAFGLKLPYCKVHSEQPNPEARLVLSMHGKLDLPTLGPYRGVHIMRDPRDMIVSGYHYHKWTHETWAHRPDEHGVSYQQKLNQADTRQGLFLEIDHFIFFYRDTLASWDTDNPDILEVAYENLMGPERDGLYGDMFTHLGLEGRDLELAIDLMRLFEAKSRTGRVSGKVATKSHLRSGRSGQWQSELEEDHVAYIEKELGSVLRKFGY